MPSLNLLRVFAMSDIVDPPFHHLSERRVSHPRNIHALPREDPTLLLRATRDAPKSPNVISLTKSSCALQSKARKAEILAILAPLDEKLLPLFEGIADVMEAADPRRWRFRLVEDKDEAKLGLLLTSSGRSHLTSSTRALRSTA
ncbi:hypothetical protein K443DRAFT_10988 [Laccaria amethystina LaAM-08-1]|uniref:Uncharacterized protein n=1 Tax=Laccaria amethystina LaAM-08-1 TaxID=1095629 RepID=A0A0C9WK74_9AGAR|nr:hypothetical protein K443DRAFT_10988 [Laccaria amethystina LaAM-08-1]